MTEEGPPGAPDEGAREFVRYLFWRLQPEWRRRPPAERSAEVDEFVARLERPPEGVIARTYSLVGTKASADGLLWTIGPRLEAFQEFESRLRGCALASYLEFPFGYLGMTRRSEYLGGHAHAGQEGPRAHPSDRPYLVVYPFVKKRAWYGLPFEERRRIMAQHFQIGHRFPRVEIHTGYSFGLDDAEFILAFEAESPGEFLDLVEALRPSEASRYTEVETPIFTCLAADPRRTVELAAGRP